MDSYDSNIIRAHNLPVTFSNINFTRSGLVISTVYQLIDVAMANKVITTIAIRPLGDPT